MADQDVAKRAPPGASLADRDLSRKEDRQDVAIQDLAAPSLPFELD